MNLPRNDMLIADAEEKPDSAEKVRLDMLESLFLTPYIYFIFYIKKKFNYISPFNITLIIIIIFNG